MIRKINHIAIVAPNLDDGHGFWAEALGLPVIDRRREAEQGVDVSFMTVGESHIEIIAPIPDLTEETGVSRYLQKTGGGMHHLCLEVADITAALDRLRAHNVPLIDETPRVNSEGRKMAFIHPKGTGGVLVELYEVNENEADEVDEVGGIGETA